MVTLMRRLLVLIALMFWQGGFTFYASVVVPVAQQQLGHRGQGFITNEVTNFLNLSGAIALAVLAWDLSAAKDRPGLRRYLLWTCWAGMVVVLVLLVRQHMGLADMMIPAHRQLTNPRLFQAMHRWYLWLSTVQWGLAIAYTGLLLWVWRCEDRCVPPEPERAPGRRQTVSAEQFAASPRPEAKEAFGKVVGNER
jgi:hypothetical protein